MQQIAQPQKCQQRPNQIDQQQYAAPQADHQQPRAQQQPAPLAVRSQPPQRIDQQRNRPEQQQAGVADSKLPLKSRVEHEHQPCQQRRAAFAGEIAGQPVHSPAIERQPQQRRPVEGRRQRQHKGKQ